jgi:translation initiation factor 2 subunit 2
MADEEMVFDPSQMKKKKKGIKKFDIDAAALEAASAPGPGAGDDDGSSAAQDEGVGSNAAGDNFTDSLLDLETFGKKKKKKKPTATATTAAAVAAVQENVSDAEDGGGADDGTGGVDDDLIGATEELSLEFGGKRKKKPKKKKDLEDLVAVELENEENESPGGEGSNGTGNTWLGSDRDYTYDELLFRVFDIMRTKNPEMASGTKQKFVMRPPQVVRIGTKKTSFVNFMEICKMLHRPQKHLLDFLLSELGTSGSIDGNNQLIIKGRFQQKQIENVLRRYIKEYVTCHTCRSPNTLLQKDSRIFFLQCEACGSRCSVVSIKHGFQAVTGKRAAIRAKAT